MGYLELLILAIGLSMDAFAVAICKGLAMKKVTLKKATIVGMYFGVFQAGMPLLGYVLGRQFKDQINDIDHWIAFFLLGIIGINMIKESLTEDCNCSEECDISDRPDESLGFRKMVVLAIATSIDALAVGITFAIIDVKIYSAVAMIGVTTCILSMIGVKVGNIFGVRFKSKAELFGGVILIILGTKILLEHLGII